MLSIQHLSIVFGSTRILQSITFQARPGKILGIIGPNGAGKTTLLRAISGLIPIDKGELSYANHSLLKMPAEARARLIASVPQATALPPAFSVRDVVMLGRTPYMNWMGQPSMRDNEIVNTAMRQTHTEKLADRRLDELSAGEQQRILLARALAQSTPVLLMDEPTSHLDLRYQIELLDLTRNLVQQEKKTALLVLHDLNLASRYADGILLLNMGKLAAFGLPQDVLRAEILSEVYQIPIQINHHHKKPHIFPK